MRATVGFVGFAMVVVLGFTGCATFLNQVQEPGGPDSAFVYGKVDLSPADDAVTFVSMMRYPYQVRAYLGEVTDVSFHVFSDGTFFAENVDAGQYFLSHFNGTKQFNTVDVYYIHNPDDWNDESKLTLHTVEPGEFEFVGAYEIELLQEAGVLGLKPGSFTLQPVPNTGDDEVLQEILPHVEGTAWHGKILELLGR